MRGSHDQSESVAQVIDTSGIAADDYKVSRVVLSEVQEKWGECTIDAFASVATAMLPRFWTAEPKATAEATDAFTLPWKHGERLWAHPPVYLLDAFAKKLLAPDRHAEVFACVPYRPSNDWYYRISKLADDKKKYMAGVLTKIGEHAPERLESWPMMVFRVPAKAPLEGEKVAHSALPPSRDPPMPDVSLNAAAAAGSPSGAGRSTTTAWAPTAAPAAAAPTVLAGAASKAPAAAAPTAPAVADAAPTPWATTMAPAAVARPRDYVESQPRVGTRSAPGVARGPPLEPKRAERVRSSRPTLPSASQQTASAPTASTASNAAASTASAVGGAGAAGSRTTMVVPPLATAAVRAAAGGAAPTRKQSQTASRRARSQQHQQLRQHLAIKHLA